MIDDEPEDERGPTHLTRTLWRYMSFAKFLWLLQNKKLWLARADTLNDPWELALAGEQLELVILRRPIRRLDSTEPQENIYGRAIRINKRWRETTFISCWSSAEHEFVCTIEVILWVGGWSRHLRPYSYPSKSTWQD